MAIMPTYKIGGSKMKKSQFKNADAAATRKQTWAVFCMSKVDIRDEKLTRWETSKLIGKLKKVKSIEDRANIVDDFVAKSKQQPSLPFKSEESTPKKKSSKYDAVEVLKAAKLEGMKALNKVTPTPMIVEQHENPLDDSSPLEKAWVVDGGVCGFAWVVIKCKGKGVKFINGLKKAGIAGGENSHKEISRSSYHKGFMYWVHEGNQSYELKTAYASAMAKYLRSEHGIECYSGSRLD
jgi:hypothetical protein